MSNFIALGPKREQFSSVFVHIKIKNVPEEDKKIDGTALNPLTLFGRSYLQLDASYPQARRPT
jgi:hypothetical protein